jgi:cation:H+ antiporter
MFVELINALGLEDPITYVALFLAASFLMIWRLEAMGRHGLEGTALGTLITPYCSGLGNLVFVYLILRDHRPGQEVVVNCLVNNVTNLMLVLAVPALIWGMEIIPSKASAAAGKTGKGAKAGTPAKARPAGAKKSSGKADTERRLSRLSLLLTMGAVAFFTGAVWALGANGKLGFNEGLVLVGLFLFWQCFQVFDVLKHNIQQNRSFSGWFYLDFLLVLLGAWALYESLDWLVHWLETQRSGFVSVAHLGWLSGWLMVLPNAVLALYYAKKSRADIVYASQIGDGHICIPLCIGLYALARPMKLGAHFESGVILLGAALAIHFFCVAVLGRLPKPIAALLIVGYAYFVYDGLLAG